MPEPKGRTLTLYLSDEQARYLDRFAIERGWIRSRVMVQALSAYFASIGLDDWPRSKPRYSYREEEAS